MSSVMAMPQVCATTRVRSPSSGQLAPLPAPARDDVLEPSTLLRIKLRPMANPWSDGLPYPQDDDLVSLRVVKHHTDGMTRHESWANAGGYNYGADTDFDDDGEPAMPKLPKLPSWAVRAGPRQTVYFHPGSSRAAIVTVGGICPGLNDIVRCITIMLEKYGVPDIRGIKFGLRGFYEGEAPIKLTRDVVERIHEAGGTFLGTTRGGGDVPKICDAIERMKLDLVFIAGGNGGNAAVHAINQELETRGFPCAVAGLPKSIDNDILLIDKCFGYNTAVAEAEHAIQSAVVEARSQLHGVGVVKLMGRSAGFIAAQAAIASGEVDVCLIPELPFDVDKVCGFVHTRLKEHGYAIVVVSEGAGQELIEAELEAVRREGDPSHTHHDASGNPVLHDVGRWLVGKIKDYSAKRFDGIVPDVKYMNPAYLIRSVRACTSDRVLCHLLAAAAVHGAFAGYSGFTSGLCSRHLVLLPAAAVVQAPRRMDPRGKLFRMMTEAVNAKQADIGPPRKSSDGAKA